VRWEPGKRPSGRPKRWWKGGITPGPQKIQGESVWSDGSTTRLTFLLVPQGLSVEKYLNWLCDYYLLMNHSAPRNYLAGHLKPWTESRSSMQCFLGGVYTWVTSRIQQKLVLTLNISICNETERDSQPASSKVPRRPCNASRRRYLWGWSRSEWSGAERIGSAREPTLQTPL
jgi:hypothetical protein